MKSLNTTIVELPCGAGTFNSNLNQYRVPINDLVQATNVRYDNATIQKAPGAALLDEIDSAGKCLGLSQYFVNSGTAVILSAWADGNIYKSSGVNFDAVDLGTFGSPTAPVIMVPFSNLAESGSTVDNRMAFFSRAVVPTTVVGNGGSYTAFTGVSADWGSGNGPSAGCLHDFRLCAFGVAAYPHNIYFSTLADLTQFTGAGSKVMSVYPGEGQRIVAGMSYLETNLILWKYPLGIYLVDTTDLTAPVNPAYRISNTLGGVSPRGVTKVNDDIWFISPNGHVHTMSQVRPDIDPKLSDVTHMLNLSEFIRRNVNLARLEWAQLYFDVSRQEVIYTFPSKFSASGENDGAIIFKLPTQSQPLQASIDRRGLFYAALAPQIDAFGDQMIVAGGEAGDVWQFNHIINGSPRFSVDGEGYRSVFSHPGTDFAWMAPEFASLEKAFKFLDLQFLPNVAGGTFYIDIIVDDELRRTESVTIEAGNYSYYDLDAYDSATYSTFEEQYVRLPLDVVGRKIQFVCYNNEADEAFAVTAMHVEFAPADTIYEKV